MRRSATLGGGGRPQRFTSAPPATRSFASPGAEWAYLYDQLLFWLYARDDRRRALPYARRLDAVLRRSRGAMQTAKGNESRALIAEAERDWPAAIRYRRREIALFERIRAIAPQEPPIARRAILRDFSGRDLADRYDLLAIACWEAGRLEDALAALGESERICRRHRVRFDSAALRRAVLRERARVGA